MKRVFSLLACTMLVACSCSENQWEEVDNVTFEDTEYAEPAPYITPEPMPVVEAAPVVVQQQPSQVIVRPEPVYVGAPQPVYDCPCAEVAPQPCYQPSCMPVCGCQAMPAPQPKVTKTKKIITTTTTLEEPCGKPVCEPVVTTHEEIIPAEVTYTGYEAPSAQPQNDIVEVQVEQKPYRSEVVGMKSANAKVDASVAAKYSPEAYIVVATRATNRMLQDTSAIYDSGKARTVYIKDTKLLSSDLPYGSHRLKGATKDIISGSKTYEVVNNINNADFVIDTSADWYVAPDNTMPALQYKLSMYDRNGKKVNEWVEIIRQVQD